MRGVRTDWKRVRETRDAHGPALGRSNKRMHATRDTNHFMFRRWRGRARDARRYAANLQYLTGGENAERTNNRYNKNVDTSRRY